ncbi:O-antigen ligase family protein [Salinicoccus roseus]|nr:O-antigen ligase family protein [Salinicoccus roseus]
MTFFGFLSVVKTLILYGSMEAASIHFVGRYAVDLWSNEPISATVINLRFSLGLALLPILFLAKDKYTPYVKSIKLISLVCFIASFYSIILLGNRTGIAIAIISFLIVFIISRKISLKKVSNLFVIVMSIILFAILYNNNWLGLKASWQASALSYRLQSNSSLEDPRVNAWIESFLGMFTNPLGGKKSDIGLTYAHNLWLDVGYETGILPFLLLIGFTIIPLTVLITFLKKNHHVIFKGLFLAIFTAFFISFFLEPIIQAWFPYFTIFCFFIGIIQKINLKTKEKKIL